MLIKWLPLGLKNCKIWHSHKTRKPTEGQEASQNLTGNQLLSFDNFELVPKPEKKTWEFPHFKSQGTNEGGDFIQNLETLEFLIWRPQLEQ
ncbi:Uncharacterized protein XB16_3235 [Leptospira santarosai]|uniref:Uncharacterized protein n=1 Tax=Leptospira santarosai TaxID=28183 RepID=A0A2P1QXQ6_9LEPT|nr:Uncharacterized protein XB16_3235 [Leptospira santarosai]